MSPYREQAPEPPLEQTGMERAGYHGAKAGQRMVTAPVTVDIADLGACPRLLARRPGPLYGAIAAYFARFGGSG